MLTKLLGMKVSSLVSTGEMIEDKLQGEELLLEGMSLPPYLKLEPFLFGLPLWADSKAETEMSTGITLLLIRRLSLFRSAYFVPLLFSLLKSRVPSHLGWLVNLFSTVSTSNL